MTDFRYTATDSVTVTKLGVIPRLVLALVRAYVRWSPIPRGKGYLVRHVLVPLLPPPPSGFSARNPGKGTVLLHYKEELGLSTLLTGGFEHAEIQDALDRVRASSTVIDVGANIGAFTIPLGHAVGTEGRVFAFEPLEENVARLEANIHLNHLLNVTIFPFALGARQGKESLHLATDPAYSSTVGIRDRRRATGRKRSVAVKRLDDVWRERGGPQISFMKIDVEGGELAILKGARDLVQECRPALLVEANSPEQRLRLEQWMQSLGYMSLQPRDFRPWNLLFEPGER